jgi:Nif11 domain
VSKQELQRFLEDVAAQPRLRQSFDDNPNAAIAGYEIAPEEMGALKSRDPARLQKLGIDDRLSGALARE